MVWLSRIFESDYVWYNVINGGVISCSVMSCNVPGVDWCMGLVTMCVAVGHHSMTISS